MHVSSLGDGLNCTPDPPGWEDIVQQFQDYLGLCRVENSVKVCICSMLYIDSRITPIGPPPPEFQGCENERNEIHNVRVLRQKLKVFGKIEEKNFKGCMYTPL